MPKFVFRFESLLEHRRQIEAERQRELAVRLRTRLILQQQLQDMQRTISEAKRQISDRLVGRVDLDAIARIGTYSGQSQARGHQIVQRMAGLEREIHMARTNLLDATRQRKALEVLRDRHEQQWRLEQRRLEQRQTDEIASQAYVRRQLTEARR